MNYKAIVEGLEKELEISIEWNLEILQGILNYHPDDIIKARTQLESYRLVKTLIEDLKDKNK